MRTMEKPKLTIDFTVSDYNFAYSNRFLLTFVFRYVRLFYALIFENTLSVIIFKDETTKWMRVILKMMIILASWYCTSLRS
jgi:hypothetical protein